MTFVDLETNVTSGGSTTTSQTAGMTWSKQMKSGAVDGDGRGRACVVSGVVQVQSMKSPTAVKTGGVYDLLKRATILLTVRGATGSEEISVNSSVVPRQNVW